MASSKPKTRPAVKAGKAPGKVPAKTSPRKPGARKPTAGGGGAA